MLSRLQIRRFKSLVDEDLRIAPLTIFTGTNSSGKSSALQAILITQTGIQSSEEFTRYIDSKLVNSLNFDERASAMVEIMTTYSDGRKATVGISNSRQENFGSKFSFKGGTYFTKTLFISADRVGPSDFYPVSYSDDLGIRGQYSWQYFEKNKNRPLHAPLLHPEAASETLAGQVNFWMNHIVETTVTTEGTDNQVRVAYNYLDRGLTAPSQTGFGTSTLFPIVLACLVATPADLVVLENPEIHLHPKAQARLADLFAFTGNAGIQLIIETHCEHLIYKLCYNVHKGILKTGDVVFHYREENFEQFEEIVVDDSGRFLSRTTGEFGFPRGFFDATLEEYISIYG